MWPVTAYVLRSVCLSQPLAVLKAAKPIEIAVWDMDSDARKEPYIIFYYSPPKEGAILENGPRLPDPGKA